MQEPSWLTGSRVPNGTISEAGFQVHIAIAITAAVEQLAKENTLAAAS
jgi:hypothetical protein